MVQENPYKWALKSMKYITQIETVIECQYNTKLGARSIGRDIWEGNDWNNLDCSDKNMNKI